MPKGWLKNSQRKEFLKSGEINDRMVEQIASFIKNVEYTKLSGDWSKLIRSRDLAMLGCLYVFGLKSSEICRLRLSDYGFDGDYVYLHVKNRTHKRPFIGKYIGWFVHWVDWLNRYMSGSGKKNVYIFPAFRIHLARSRVFIKHIGSPAVFYVTPAWLGKPLSVQRIHQIVTKWDNRLTPCAFHYRMKAIKEKMRRDIEKQIESLYFV